MIELPSFATSGLNALLQWAAARGLVFGFEQSARFVHGRLDTERGLFSFDVTSLGETGLSETLMICHAMRAPEQQLQAVRRFFPATAFVHFGFEKAGAVQVGKCYLELPMAEQRSEHHGSECPPRLQFLGFKWSMSHPSMTAVTRYRLLPAAAWDQVQLLLLAPLDAALRPGLNQLLSCVENAGGPVRQPSPHLPAEDSAGVAADCQLLEIEDEGSQRRSYDLNIYDRQLSLHQLECSLLQISDVLQIPENSMRQWLSIHATATAGHLAAGRHRDRQSFLTVYFGARQIGM